MRVWSLALLGGLKDLVLQWAEASSCSADLTPSLGTFTCHGWSLKKPKQNKTKNSVIEVSIEEAMILGVLNTSFRNININKMLFPPSTYSKVLFLGSSMIHGLRNPVFHFLIPTTHKKKYGYGCPDSQANNISFQFSSTPAKLVQIDVKCMGSTRFSDSLCLFKDDSTIKIKNKKRWLNQ